MDGNRGSLLVPNRNAACQQINSVYVQTLQGGSFEFGWIIGWSNCAGYRTQFYHEPTAFAWWTNNNGTGSCRVFETRTPSAGNYHQFRASDVDNNSYWGAWLNGVELQPNGVNMDFTQGLGAIGMERGDDADSGYTSFRNMQENHDSNGWTAWNNLSLNRDLDPDYRLRRDAPDAGVTIQ